MVEYGGRSARILDFDIENMPLTYGGADFTFSDITAIACKWIGATHHYVWLVGGDDPKQMLEEFSVLYRKADLVTGHYIRNHDCPIINGALVELGLPELPRKMTCDTKNDLIGFSGISKSQENLAEMFGLKAQKVQMNQVKWRAANRFTQEGLKLTRKRVVGDIYQHEQLRAELLRRNLLKAPRPWGTA
jgi:hypothetical protein